MKADRMELARIAEAQRGELGEGFLSLRDYVEISLEAGEWPQGVASMGSGGSRLVEVILEEMHVLLCTDDERYESVRREGADFARACLPAVAGYVAGSVGLTVAVASGAVAFIALTVFKVGTAAFCRARAERVA